MPLGPIHQYTVATDHVVKTAKSLNGGVAVPVLMERSVQLVLES
jgi:hypothetical protein